MLRHAAKPFMLGDDSHRNNAANRLRKEDCKTHEADGRLYEKASKIHRICIGIAGTASVT